MNPRSSLLLLGILFPILANADVRLPAIFSDHMVLQRELAVPVWGWAEPGEVVTVSIAGQAQTATADAACKWSVTLAPIPSAEPTSLTVTGKNTLVIHDVLVGEVWLGSGQSNMAMTVNRAKDYEQEQAAANFPRIRVFTEKSTYAKEPAAECQGSWQVCAPETVASFSATAYFFGRELHQALDVPVGLVVSAVGGTPIESWIDSEAAQSSPALKPYLAVLERERSKASSPEAKAIYEKKLARWEAQKATPPAADAPPLRKPLPPDVVAERQNNLGGLYNGKIAPLIPFAIRGVIWYQGEANSRPEKSSYYKDLLPYLVTGWRADWGRELPFAWVQLAGLGRSDEDWSIVREGMLQALSLPQTGMAVAVDIGEERDVHPKNKQDVGKRLAAWALGTVYHKSVPATSGPLPAGHEIRGGEIVLRFTHTEGGLQAKGNPLKGFVIAGDDEAWKPAQARIEGNTVVVLSPEVPSPKHVRYAWAGFTDANLYNGAGLPASPFRTAK
jgi:sialate O-acetylesterase